MANTQTIYTFADLIQGSRVELNGQKLRGVLDWNFVPDQKELLPYRPLNSPRTLYNLGRLEGGTLSLQLTINETDKTHKVALAHRDSGEDIPISFITRGKIVNNLKSKSGITLTGKFKAKDVAAAVADAETTISNITQNPNVQIGDHLVPSNAANTLIITDEDDSVDGDVKLKAVKKATGAISAITDTETEFTVIRPAVRYRFNCKIRQFGPTNIGGNKQGVLTAIFTSPETRDVGNPDIA